MRRNEIEIVEESESTDNPSINGRYHRFNLKLGKGAFKEVYKAFDTHEQIDVAWNSIDLSLINAQNERNKIFKECEMLRRLNHPHILKITNQWFNHKTEKLCFITNIVQDGSLAKFFKKRQVNLLRVKQISKQILKALVYLHSNGVIHRDIKCDNIFIEGNTGKVVVGDLGLSCNVISARSIVGTPHWMAPELFKEEYDEMVDIWSFGMCVLELITSSIPYNECKGAFQVYQNISVGKKPEILKKINDPSVKSFINICLNVDPRMRPSAEELLEHPFLYHTSKDIILCNELMKPKVIEPVISMEEKKEEELMKYILSSPANKQKLKEDMVKVKKVENNGDIIKIKLQIICSKFGKPMNVQFDFSHKEEKPSSVAAEMTRDLKLPNHFRNKVEKAIKKAIAKAVKQKFTNGNNDTNKPPPNVLQTSVTSLTASVPSQLHEQTSTKDNTNNTKIAFDPMYAKPMDKIYECNEPIDYLTQSPVPVNNNQSGRDHSLCIMYNNNNARDSVRNTSDGISSNESVPQISHSDINLLEPVSTAGNTSVSNSIPQQMQISNDNINGEHNSNVNNIYGGISISKSSTPPSSPPVIAIKDHNHSVIHGNNIVVTNTNSRSPSPHSLVHKLVNTNATQSNVLRDVLSDGLMALKRVNNKTSEIGIFKATIKLTLAELKQEFVKRNKLYNESEGKVGLARKLVNILRDEMDTKNNKQEDSISSPTNNKKEQTPDSVLSAKSSSKKSDNEPKESVLKLRNCDSAGSNKSNIDTIQQLPNDKMGDEMNNINSSQINMRPRETFKLPFAIEELKFPNIDNYTHIFDSVILNEMNKKQLELHNEYIDFIQRKYTVLQLKYPTLENEMKIKEENIIKNKINEKRNELMGIFSEWLNDRQQIAALKSRIEKKRSMFNTQLEFENDPRFVALMKSELNENDKQKCKIEIENYRKQMINNYNQFIKQQENKLSANSEQESQDTPELDTLEILSQLEHIAKERVADSIAFQQFMSSIYGTINITNIPKDKIKSCLGSSGGGKNNSTPSNTGNNSNGTGSDSGGGSNSNERGNSDKRENNKDKDNNDNKEEKDGNVCDGLCFKFGACNHINDCMDCSERIKYTKHLENIIAIQSKHILRQSEYHTSFQQIIINAIKHSINKKKKYKKKRAENKNNKNVFEPEYKAEKQIKITRKFTEHVKNNIKEPVVNVYNWISKTVSLQYNDGQINKNDKLQVINLDLHNKNNNKLYGVIRAVDKKCHFHLWMDEKLYTEKEMSALGAKVPKSSRDNLAFKKGMNECVLIKERFNIKNMKQVIEKCNWNEIHVFKCVNNTNRMTLSITKRKLFEKLFERLDGMNEFNLVPILMFKCNQHWIENVWIVNIYENICIGISLRYSNGIIKINGIHLNKKELEMRHELIHSHKCNCFKEWKSIINDIYIGDPNTLMNQMKTYKKKYEEITPLVYTLIDAKYLKEYKSVQNDAIILMKHENGNLEKSIFNKPVNYSPLTCYSSPANSSPESIIISNNNNGNDSMNVYALMQYQNQNVINGNIYQNMFNINKLSNNNNSIILNNMNLQMNNKF